MTSRLEPFDSYWQAPDDVQSGYTLFYSYYKANYLCFMPANRQAEILVISCGPGYLLNTLRDHGYENVKGIDSDSEKVSQALRRDLHCETARAHSYLEGRAEKFDVIIPEQELNHLTLQEQIEFLKLCYVALKPGGKVVVYGLNGANPLVGSENLAGNIDHFNTFTEYSLCQLLEIAGFSSITVYPLKLYVFWKNPLNYIGLAITSAFEMCCRIMFRLYGKKVKILSKKLVAVAYRL